MQFVPTTLPGVLLLQPKVFGDHRGFFLETWRKSVFEQAGIHDDFVQDNHSKSTGPILRGLHYQIRQPQGKLVRVVSGEVFDVAVDLRKSSPTFGKWVGTTLSADNKRQLWIPAGFGHAFLVLSDSADFLYRTTDYYAPQHERCVIWNDPDIGIRWPMTGEPVLAAKDRAGLFLRDADLFP